MPYYNYFSLVLFLAEPDYYTIQASSATRRSHTQYPIIQNDLTSSIPGTLGELSVTQLLKQETLREARSFSRGNLRDNADYETGNTPAPKALPRDS